MDRFGKGELGNSNYSRERIEQNDVEDKSSSKKVLFVCNNNMVVSMVAEAIFNDKSKQKSISAGIIFPIFSEPQFATIRICQNHGIDISNYRITHISDVEMNDVCLILTATAEIRDYLKEWYPNIEIFTIKEYAGDSNLDIEDPIGGTYDDYEKCFNEIDEAISRIIDGKIELIDKTIKTRNFHYLDDLIHSGANKIVLDSNIVISDEEEAQYLNGIAVDVEGLVIDGNGYSIDARNKARIFFILADVTLMNVTLKNAFSSKTGAAIYNNGCNLNIYDSTFSRNVVHDDKFSSADVIEKGIIVPIWGGAIFNDRGKIDILRSKFIANIANEGGAIFNGNGNMTVKNSIFSDNVSEMHGGAIYEKLGISKIYDSELSNNVAGMSGGAIFSSNGELRISNSKLSKNSADDNGGAVGNFDGRLIIEESSFLENFSKCSGGAIHSEGRDLYISGGSFSENVCEMSGGAIYIKNDDKLELIDSAFRYNSCRNSTSIIDTKGEISAKNCEFTGNESKWVVFNHDVKIMAFHDCKFKRDESLSFKNNIDCSIANFTFKNCKSDSDNLKDYFDIESLEKYLEDVADVESGHPKTKLFSEDVLFVCESNRIISPIAEAIYNRFAADKKSIVPVFKVNDGRAFSAGIKAERGNLPSFDVMKIGYNYGINLTDHETANISDFIVDDVDVILTSTTQVRNYLKIRYPNVDIFTIREYVGFSDVDIQEPAIEDYDSCEYCYRKVFEAILKMSEYGDEIRDNPTEINNFNDLDYFIRGGFEEIVLTSDVTLGEFESMDYEYGIKVDIDKDIVIDGNNHCIDGKGEIRFFEILRGNVTLRNITFKNGFGKVKMDMKDNIIHQCLITNSADCSLKIENCNFIDNHSSTDNFIENQGMLELNNVNFINNDFSWLILNTGEMDISNCNFENYLAGIMINSPDYDLNANHKSGHMKISGSTFTENMEIMLNFGNLTIINSEFKKNKRLGSNKGDLNLFDCCFEDNSAKNGAFIHNLSKLNVFDCKFHKNASDDGKLIENRRKIKINDCDFFNEKFKHVIFNEDYMEISKCIFHKNNAMSIIENANEESILYVNLAEFTGNDSRYSTVNNFGDICSITKTKFTDNHSSRPNSDDIYNEGRLKLNEVNLKGSQKSIFNYSQLILHSRHDFISNIFNFGEIVFEDEMEDATEYNFTLLDNLIHSGDLKIVLENDFAITPSEFDFYEGGIELDIDNLEIDGGGRTIHASNRSRMFIVTAQNVTLKNIVFEGGFNFENFDDDKCGGGAIQINSKGSLFLKDCKFKGNKSKKYGGAIHNYGYADIRDVEFSNNKSNGGVLVNNKNAVLDIEKGFFIGNSGGAIINDGNMIFQSCEFKSGKSSDWPEIFNRENGVIEMSLSQFNSGSSNKSIIKNEPNAVLRADNIFWSHNKSNSLFNQGYMELKDSKLCDNYSPENSGGIRNSGKIKMDNIIFLNNKSEHYGGAVSNFFDGIMEINNSQFINNQTAESAGAIANIGKISIENCKFCSNASKDGGAINNEGKIKISSCMFQDNSSSYGGAITNYKMMTILDSEFNSNSSKIKGNSILNSYGIDPSFDEERLMTIPEKDLLEYLIPLLIVKDTHFSNRFPIQDEIDHIGLNNRRIINCRFNAQKFSEKHD